jgi:RND family efflux transporter MFP subunit
MVPIGIGILCAGVLLAGGVMVVRAEARTNKVPLAASPKPVSVIEAKGAPFRASRTYVGTIDPWVEAKVGPQLVSAYVETVLVRPGAAVKKGDVLATLDCRNASATSQAVSMQARALEARQQAVAHEATRIQGLLDGGFVSSNEAEQKAAQSAAEQAQLLATQAKLLGTTLEVNDCVLRAPFDGEIAQRAIDPGAFARPGTTVVTVVDRSIIRVTADAPEVDFDAVAPGTTVSIRVLATNKDLVAKVSRRAPAADGLTRTVRFELDIPDTARAIPVGTTGELRIEVGDPIATTAVPLSAATVRGTKASVFVVDGDVARARTVALKGESGGILYLDTELSPGTRVVTEGRALLGDGDRVTALAETAPAAHATAPHEAPSSQKGAKR